MTLYYILLYMAALLAAAGQVMLKLGAAGGGLDIIIIRLNIWIALGLGAMVMSMLLTVRGLSIVPLRDLAIILPAVYIAVPVFSKIFLKENLSRHIVIGTLIIVAGIAMFNLPIIRLY